MQRSILTDAAAGVYAELNTRSPAPKTHTHTPAHTRAYTHTQGDETLALRV